eukprot:757021-Hanusia_phi.AAC.2
MSAKANVSSGRDLLRTLGRYALTITSHMTKIDDKPINRKHFLQHLRGRMGSRKRFEKLSFQLRYRDSRRFLSACKKSLLKQAEGGGEGDIADHIVEVGSESFRISGGGSQSETDRKHF